MPNYIDRSSIDSAALAGATLAATLPLFSEPGPFLPFSAIIGATLLLVLCSYEYQRQRSGWMSAAFGAVCALSALLVYGYFREVWKAGWHFDTLHNTDGSLVASSLVNHIELSVLWIIFTIVFGIIGHMGSSTARGSTYQRGEAK